MVISNIFVLPYALTYSNQLSPIRLADGPPFFQERSFVSQAFLFLAFAFLPFYLHSCLFKGKHSAFPPLRNLRIENSCEFPVLRNCGQELRFAKLSFCGNFAFYTSFLLRHNKTRLSVFLESLVLFLSLCRWAEIIYTPDILLPTLSSLLLVQLSGAVRAACGVIGNGFSAVWAEPGCLSRSFFFLWEEAVNLAHHDKYGKCDDQKIDDRI